MECLGIKRSWVDDYPGVVLFRIGSQVGVSTTDFETPSAYRMDLAPPPDHFYEGEFPDFIGEPDRIIEVIDDFFPHDPGQYPFDDRWTCRRYFAVDKDKIIVSGM